MVPEADGLVVVLEATGRRVSRPVSSPEDAAMWIESWLGPEAALGGEAQPSPPSVESARPGAPAEKSRAETGRSLARGRFGLLGRASLDADRAHWAGLEAFGAIDIGGPWWIGAGFGRSWDPVLGQSALGRRVARQTTHAIVRAGGVWPLSGRSELAIGTGLGILSAEVSGPPLRGGAIVSDNEGVGVVELCALARVPLSVRLELGVGLGLERTLDFEAPNAQQPDEPASRVYPEWRASLLLGAAFRFGTE